MSLSFTNSSLFTFPLPTAPSHSPHPNTPPKPLTIRMGGGPRTFPGGVSKWQWKRMQAKKSKQLLKARLARERQIYEMRKRAELKAAVAQLERPWEPVKDDDDGVAVSLFSVSADEQVKVLADRFQKPGGFDLWTEKDGPVLFGSSRGAGELGSVGEVGGEGLRRSGERGGGSGGRETSRFINGLNKGKEKSRVDVDGGSGRRVEGRVNFNGGREQRVESWVRNGGSDRRVGSQVGGNDRRVESRVRNGGSEWRVGSRVELTDVNDRRVESRVRNGRSGLRVGNRVTGGVSERRVRNRDNFDGGNERRVASRGSNGGNGWRVGSRVNVNGGNRRRVDNQARNGKSRSFNKVGAFRRMDCLKSEAYEMSLERDGSYGCQAKSGEGEESS